jgi:ABC-type Fe3+ transport system substrate-binding protein
MRPGRQRRWAAAITGSALACGLLAACGGSSGSSDPSITLYSGQHEQTTNNLVTAFEKKTGITVNVRSDDEDTLADQIALQGSHSPVDVFYTENSPPLESLQEKGLLARLPQSTLADTPARYSSPQGDWVGVSARVSVLIYNPSLISASQLPTQVRQLADPRYKGKLAIAPHDPGYVVDVSGAAVLKSSSHQAAAQKFVAFLVSKQGQEIIASPSKSLSFEYPIASGVTTQSPETPFAQLQPYPITIADLGDGSTAIALMRAAGLL